MFQHLFAAKQTDTIWNLGLRIWDFKSKSKKQKTKVPNYFCTFVFLLLI